MIKKPVPINKEHFVTEGDLLVSKTDLKGIITYCNHFFINISGYSYDELLGAPHNIVRHPDMPKGLFKLLWSTIQKGEEIFAFVKNLSKTGGFYWVYANVTPVWNGADQIIGYYSVRRKPHPEAVKEISSVYQKMSEIEKNNKGKSGMDDSVLFLLNQLSSHNVSYEEYAVKLQFPSKRISIL